MNETLFVRVGSDGLFYLRDSREAFIGTFKTAEEVKAWCDENGYRLRGLPSKKEVA